MQAFTMKNPQLVFEIYQKIDTSSLTLIEAINNQSETSLIFNLFNQNQILLEELSKVSGIDIVTPELKIIAKSAELAGTAGKLSGAGGGDCGFAIYETENQKEKIIKAWKDSGIELIDTKII